MTAAVVSLVLVCVAGLVVSGSVTAERLDLLTVIATTPLPDEVDAR